MVTARVVRGGEKVSAPIDRDSGVKGARVGTDRSCSVSTGHDGG